MKRAFLLTGFNNWGKTTQIYKLFDRSKFYYGKTYGIPNVKAEFIVESHSNDDFNESEFIDTIWEKYKQSPKTKDLFCAFCPTRDKYNDSYKILTSRPFTKYDEIHLILLRYKWDFHAELRVKEIKKYLSPIGNTRFFIVDADSNHTKDDARSTARHDQIVRFLQSIYP